MLRGRYKILKIINSGGFGNVYLAHDQTFDKNVAIKEAFYSDEETRKQFDFEAQVLIHVNHKDMVRGYEAFEERGRFYLVMQYIEGPNLEELQIKYFKESRHPIPEPIVLRLMSITCSATQALHDGHILHRDIKPANIKLNGKGDPILLDLGLAKLYKSPESITLIAARAYTPGYAPPEQCEEESSTTESTDIYALGATTYYSLTGRQPWEALKRLAELNLGHADLPPPSSWLPSISPATDAVVMRALTLDPAKRYPNPRTMQIALDAAQHLLTLPATARQMVMCPTCYVPNSTRNATCSNCGTVLQPAAHDAITQANTIPVAPAQALASPVGGAQPVEIKSPVSELPAVIINTVPMPMPAQPERMAPRRVVLPRMSTWATLTLLMGLATLVPVVGWFLLIVVPFIGFHAMQVIRRSQGSRRGIGRTNLGLIFMVLGLVEAVALIWFYIHMVL